MHGEEVRYRRLGGSAANYRYLTGADHLAEDCCWEADPDMGREQLRVILLLLLRGGSGHLGGRVDAAEQAAPRRAW